MTGTKPNCVSRENDSGSDYTRVMDVSGADEAGVGLTWLVGWVVVVVVVVDMRIGLRGSNPSLGRRSPSGPDNGVTGEMTLWLGAMSMVGRRKPTDG